MNVKPPNSNATIAFTLPISCQICLGKVKQPVVCPNQHVFCSPCMELWLERNQQCPACRIQITRENPCREVLGGLNPETGPRETFGNKDLRRARMELIYKDYENEIDRLQAELAASQQETKELRVLVRSQDGVVKPEMPASPVMSEQDRNTISLLNNKLRDATECYDKVKAELSTCKQDNMVLRDKNLDLQRQAENMRKDLTGRSPRRYGRYTVATLESKVDASEKQIAKLQKALERSDAYIEDLEKRLEENQSHRETADDIEKGPKLRKVDGKSFDLSRTEGSTLNDSEFSSRISNISEPLSDVAISDFRLDDSRTSTRTDQHNYLDNSTFNLEVPSPSKSEKMPGTSKYTKEGRHQGEDSFGLPKPSTSAKQEPTLDGCRKNLRFMFADSDEPSTSGDVMAFTKPTMRTQTSTGDVGDNIPRPQFTMDTEAHEGETMADLNISMTSDLEDCFRMMNEAARKLHQRKLASSLPKCESSMGLGTSGTLTQSSSVNSTSGTEAPVLFPKSADDNIPSRTVVANILGATNAHPGPSLSLPSSNSTVPYPRRPDSLPHPASHMGQGAHPASHMGQGPHPASHMGQGAHPASHMGQGAHPVSHMGQGAHPASHMGQGAHPAATYIGTHPATHIGTHPVTFPATHTATLATQQPMWRPSTAAQQTVVSSTAIDLSNQAAGGNVPRYPPGSNTDTRPLGDNNHYSSLGGSSHTFMHSLGGSTVQSSVPTATVLPANGVNPPARPHSAGLQNFAATH